MSQIKRMLTIQFLKEEIDCVFMTRQGCNYNGGHCDPVVQACEVCGHIKEVDEEYCCVTSANPSAKWNLVFATTPLTWRRKPRLWPRPR